MIGWNRFTGQPFGRDKALDGTTKTENNEGGFSGKVGMLAGEEK